jgi:UDP-glucose 4-epimerase
MGFCLRKKRSDCPLRLPGSDAGNLEAPEKIERDGIVKFLVTGGAGFIGSNIVKALIHRGETVTVLDNLSTGKLENIKDFLPRTEFIQGDIRDRETVKTAVKGIDVVLHQAALPSVPRSVKDPVSSNDVNIGGTLNLLEEARSNHVRRFVFASSSSVYGDSGEGRKKEDLPADPLSPYALTKFAGERYCRIFWRLHGLQTVCLRYFNVFGPNQDPSSDYAAVIPAFIRRMKSGEPPVIYGDGNQTRDFTYVENVVHANMLASQVNGIAGEVFNIGCGNGVSVNELAETLCGIMGFQGKAVHADPRPGDVLHSQADIGKARKVLGYTVRAGFRKGLEKTVDYFVGKG